MKRPSWRLADVRLIAVGVVFVLAWVGIGYRLFVVQGAYAADFAQRGFDQRVREETIDPPRGTIFDRDGVELAVSVDGKTIVADPSVIEDPVRTAELLAPALGLNYVDLAKKLEGDGRFAYVARRVEPQIADQAEAIIDEHELIGISLIDEEVRVYPARSLASNIIGLTALDDGRGVEGLELLFDDTLAGEPGRLIVERDPGGRVIPQGEYLIEPAQPGGDIVTTIHRGIQHLAQEALEEAMLRTKARGGTVLVLDPNTGEILALASAPTFDPADRSTLDPESVRNRAISEIYEPGSTMKPFVVAAAIDSGLVHPGTRFEIPAVIQVDDREFEDPYRMPSVQTVADIVARSSNIGTIEIQHLLGDERHYEYLDAFGFGHPASIDFVGESSGLLRHVDEWCGPCGSSHAIGYNVSVTALQMAAAYGVLANDGEWVEPYIVADIVESDGTHHPTEPRRRRVVTTETAQTVRRLLAGVVERGTGERAAVPGYTVGGKTGTTERFDPELGGYSETDTIASFMGIAPINDPRIVIAVVLDSPRGTLDDGSELKFGGASAAPVFAEVAEGALQLLGVTPDTVLGDG